MEKIYPSNLIYKDICSHCQDPIWTHERIWYAMYDTKQENPLHEPCKIIVNYTLG